MKKYFTLEEAQKSLSEVKEIVRRLLESKTALDLLKSVEVEYTEDYSGNYDELNFTKINKEFHKLSYELFSRIEELEQRGCVLKDINEGLVDFFSLFDGREILLCWKYGEEKIDYWHEISDGFTGRKPINVLIKKENKQL